MKSKRWGEMTFKNTDGYTIRNINNEDEDFYLSSRKYPILFKRDTIWDMLKFYRITEENGEKYFIIDAMFEDRVIYTNNSEGYKMRLADLLEWDTQYGLEVYNKKAKYFEEEVTPPEEYFRANHFLNRADNYKDIVKPVDIMDLTMDTKVGSYCGL